ncbi:XRE family transcriptional regulator [Streptomyces sp. NBC_01478]|uniref:helix-turn-helix domain-containing protein n=1 Tax=Streptomyces sp. NBC_01478 TaxID=2903882 RepID=UPI002E31EC74|nr:DUF2690 domain-containing protein [Streptomyces sp. NBC_01478]
MPDELDPQVREFAGQLRRLVDRSGLSIAVLADRTGYGKTSWDRYLNGRLLAPKGAVIALAEVTGTSPVHLTTMWELAERAWSRSELRHDTTMEALRISQARDALGEGQGSGSVPPRPTAPDSDVRESAARPSPPGGRRRVLMVGAGVVGVLVVIAAVFLFIGNGGSGGGGRKAGAAHASVSPSVSTNPEPPAGVKCVGAGCTGKDAEATGCATDAGAVTTARTATVGTTVVEVRYSKTCAAAWGRVTAGVPGDSVRVSAGTVTETDSITATGDAIAYTPMVAVQDAAEAKACVTLASGQKGCTT